MTDQEAKFILQAYRPNGADATDANFGEALALAQRDPALGDWLARQQAFDRVVAAKLREVPPPAGLRDAILTGGRVSGARATTAWWNQPRWLALAASLAVVLSVTLAVWPKRAGADTAFTDFLIDDARHSETHGGHGPHIGALQVILSQPTTRLGTELPVDFNTLRTTGCRTIGFNQTPVLEVCFKRNGQWFHCYIVRRTDFPTAVAGAKPTITEQGNVHFATWADASHLYVVVSKTGREPLEQLI